MLAVLLLGVRLLEALHVSLSGRIAFLGLVVFWSPWAEILSGYYILSSYLAITGLSLGAWLAYLHWQRERSVSSLAGFGLCLLAAPTFDISGLYVIAIGILLVVIDLGASLLRPTGSPRLKSHLPAVGLVTIAVVVSAIWILYGYVIRHPGSFLSMKTDAPRSLIRLLFDLFYILDVGAWFSMAMPFIYARLPVLVLAIAAGTAAAVGLAGLGIVLQRARPARRRDLAIIAAIIVGICLMVVLGRPPEGTWMVRWAAKHVGPAYVWLCLLLAIGWDTVWQRSTRRAPFGEVTLLVLGLFLALQTGFAWLGMAVDFPPFGYPAELRDARRRQAAITRLHNDIVDKFPRRADHSPTIPTLDGIYLNQIYPSLFSYNLTHYRPFFGLAEHQPEFVSGPGMQTWRPRDVSTVRTLPEAVSPSFLAALADDPVIRRYYLAEIPLVPEDHRLAEKPAPTFPAVRTEKEGSTEILLNAGPFDPADKPRLQLWFAPSLQEGHFPAPTPVPLSFTIVFFSETKGDDWHGRVELNHPTQNAITIDLRQAYAFSLGHRISRLRVVLPSDATWELVGARQLP